MSDRSVTPAAQTGPGLLCETNTTRCVENVAFAETLVRSRGRYARLQVFVGRWSIAMNALCAVPRKRGYLIYITKLPAYEKSTTHFPALMEKDDSILRRFKKNCRSDSATFII